MGITDKLIFQFFTKKIEKKYILQMAIYHYPDCLATILSMAYLIMIRDKYE